MTSLCLNQRDVKPGISHRERKIGALDIFIEPVLPKPHILILGRSPVAASLTKLAKAVNYTVSLAAPGADRENFPDPDLLQTDLELSNLKITPQTFIVVSTQGEYDEEALEKALNTSVAYVAFVASKTKASKVLEYLRDRGVTTARLNQVRAPAGLDILAASPEEIAVCILAEIIQVKGAKSVTPKPEFPVLAQEVKDRFVGCRWRQAPQSINRNSTAKCSISAMLAARTNSRSNPTSTRLQKQIDSIPSIGRWMFLGA